MKSFIKRHQLLIFFALVFIISWLPWYTGGHGFFTWGPSLAGLIVVAFVDGKKGLRDMLRRLLRWRVGIVWWVVALLGPAVLILITIGIHVLTGGNAPSFIFWKQEWYMAPVLMLVLLLPIGGPGGEETFGWRGYAQPKLQEKWGQWGPLIASFIIGTVWGVWHLSEFYNPTSTQYAIGLSFLGPFIVMEIANSIIMTWIYNKTGHSVLLGGVVYHLTVDIFTATMLADFTMAGMTEGIPALDLRLLTVQIVVFALAALILVIVSRGRLGYSVKYESGI